MEDDFDWVYEGCCDECSDSVHNHFDCPKCLFKNAPTDVYDNICEYDEFKCELCNAKFKRLSKTTWAFDK